MNRFYILLLFYFYAFKSFGQQLAADTIIEIKKNKPIIDSLAVNNWPILSSNVSLSKDGKYFNYSYSKGPSENYTMVVSKTDFAWKHEYVEVDFNLNFFSKDAKQIVFKIRDTLCFLNLQSKKIRKVINVSLAKNPEDDNGQWIAYLLKDSCQTLIVYDLVNQQEHQFPSIDDFFFDKSGKTILLKSKTSLKWVTLPNFIITDIWEDPIGNGENNYFSIGHAFSLDGSQLTFITKHNEKKKVWKNETYQIKGNIPPSYDLWYYRQGMDKAVLKASNNSMGINKGLFIFNSMPRFSKDGNFIYFQLYRPYNYKAKPGAVMVDIWSYKDTILQCTQLGQELPPSYDAVIGTTDNNTIQLTNDYERIKTYSDNRPEVVVSCNTMGDRFWLNQEDTNWLVSLKDGSRKALPLGNKQFIFSPGGKHLLYFNNLDYNYYNYNPVTKKSTNITSSIKPALLAIQSEYNFEEPENLPRAAIGIAGWEINDSALFVYDSYDVWRLDPTGNSPPLNITNGYGRSKQIKFRFTNGMVNNDYPVIYKVNESVLLTAFNTQNKYNGFFTTRLNKVKDPTLLVMGPWVFDLRAHNLLPLNAQNFNTGHGMAPIKANSAKIWIIKRQSTSEAPNYFVTTNFKTFKPLTNYQPQKAYNWLSAEIISWEQPEGKFSQGILYKPENFDPNKKYPVIFNYYQQRTHRMYQFPTPQYTIDNVDVAWFVSKGYLVITPDIYFTYGEPGWSAYNTIVSAANRLSQLPYVEDKKMAINGHSIGGGLTNYIITHTDKFAAALECAGVSNLISASLQLGKIDYEISRMAGMELFMGKTSIWDNPEKYIENSPIIKADKVKTPLLIMHNKVDGGMPWAQALELFLALRRLEKPVWMLQYDNGDHSLWGRKEEAMDFTIRITQFFDHYLKEIPAPRWMIHGIPARLKGIETGYERLN